MGYRAWNNYEEDAEHAYRAALSELPLRRRILIRLRQLAILALIFGLPALLIVRGLGLF